MNPTQHLNQAHLNAVIPTATVQGWLLSPTNPESKEAKPFAGMTLQDDFASF